MKNPKQALRAAVRSRKQQLSPDEISRRSRQLCAMVLNTDTYKQASAIYGYLPFNQEVNLTPLLELALSEGKQVALPKCYGTDMRFIWVSDLSQVRPSSFGAPEPIADGPAAHKENALIIVPGLIFDRLGYRIGYGGGYYDRFLSREPNHPTIGLCFDFQMTDRLDHDPHDIPVDTVFSV